jgi:hypothetical protein
MLSDPNGEFVCAAISGVTAIQSSFMQASDLSTIQMCLKEKAP